MLSCKVEEKSCKLICALVLAAMLWAVSEAGAAPVMGKVYKLRQPNGQLVAVKIWGDEFYQVVESLDGYTLVRDPVSRNICYAEVSKDGKDLKSTGIVLDDSKKSKLKVEKHARIKVEAAREKAAKARAARPKKHFRKIYDSTPKTPKAKELRQSGGIDADRLTGGAPLPGEADLGSARFAQGEQMQALGSASQGLIEPVTGQIRGLCLLIQFPDESGTVSRSEVESFCNTQGYSGFGNNGSIHDYFYEVSNYQLTYTNYVTEYFTALHEKSYYDNPDEEAGPKAQELIIEALNSLQAAGFDFSPYARNGVITALNVFYAGSTQSGWSKGLWPHQWSVGWSNGTVSTGNYQISEMGEFGLEIGTFCHENGHMICDFPDLYDYDYDSRGVGLYCLMAAGANANALNPIEVSGFLKYISGWTRTTYLTTSTPMLAIAGAAGDHSVSGAPYENTVFVFENSGEPNELFVVENRQKQRRDAALPDSGLAIWHVDNLKNNNNQNQMTQAEHFKVTLVQADGNWDLEHDRNNGDSGDLWKAPSYAAFGAASTPGSTWWNGNSSGFEIRDVSVSGATMSFQFLEPIQAGQVRNTRTGERYGFIMDAIRAAENGDTLIADANATYVEDVNFMGKAIVLRSGDVNEMANETLLPHNTTISGAGIWTPVKFVHNETNASVLKGFTITNGWSRTHGGGIYAENSSPIIESCIVKSNSAAMSGGGIFCKDSNAQIIGCTIINNLAKAASGGGICIDNKVGEVNEPAVVSSVLVKNCIIARNSGNYSGGIGVIYDANARITNCTITGNTTQDVNDGGAVMVHDANAIMKNCIVWGNAGKQVWASQGEIWASYSDIQKGYAGTGNINANPLFASAFDYHLKSRFGRWSPEAENWVFDSVLSPCINAGDPADDFIQEPLPNGGRINMGAYGGTIEASKSDYLVPPVSYDLDYSGYVNFVDYSMFMQSWLFEEPMLREDFNGDGVVDAADLGEFVLHWLTTVP